jgi:hypothetical protein
MSGPGGQDRDIACLERKRTATLAAKLHPAGAPGCGSGLLLVARAGIKRLLFWLRELTCRVRVLRPWCGT